MPRKTKYTSMSSRNCLALDVSPSNRYWFRRVTSGYRNFLMSKSLCSAKRKVLKSWRTEKVSSSELVATNLILAERIVRAHYDEAYLIQKKGVLKEDDEGKLAVLNSLEALTFLKACSKCEKGHGVFVDCRSLKKFHRGGMVSLKPFVTTLLTLT
jgi:hypothetical protein